jgi:hypothetical protein
MADGSDAIAAWPPAQRDDQRRDGTPLAAEKLARVLSNDPGWA